jgi:glycosyltransferase involved in cell wall biosynthesis
MKEENRKCVVIASVLKPVNDTRMFEKIGLTLASKGYEVHVIGSSHGKSETVTMHSLGSFRRISKKRLLAPFSVLQKLFSIRPQILIITTHELLFISFWVKAILRCKVIYDVQENYYRNIKYTNAFPLILRAPIAAYVRLKEKLSSGFVDHFILAEKSYASELSFIGDRFTIIENKVKRTAFKREQTSLPGIKLLFTGTLAESTGVFIAIDIAKALHAIDPTVQLTIIGYAPQSGTLGQIQRAVTNSPFIHLSGGDHLVAHEVILENIRNADFGIVSYPPNPSTSGSIPTKLYEYLGFQLPVLLIDGNPRWIELCNRYSAAVLFQYPLAGDVERLYGEMKNRAFYTTIPEEVFWESEELKLLPILVL